MGEGAPAQELITMYDQRAQELDDDDFKKLEVAPCDVKDI